MDAILEESRVSQDPVSPIVDPDTRQVLADGAYAEAFAAFLAADFRFFFTADNRQG